MRCIVICFIFYFFFLLYRTQLSTEWENFLFFATVPTLGFRWGLIWSISGLLGGEWVSCRVVLYGYQVDPWSTSKWRGIDVVDVRLFGVHRAR